MKEAEFKSIKKKFGQTISSTKTNFYKENKNIGENTTSNIRIKHMEKAYKAENNQCIFPFGGIVTSIAIEIIGKDNDSGGLNYLEVLFELFEEREPQRLDDFALSLVVLELPQLEQFSAVFVSLAFLFLPNIFHLLKFCKFFLLI